MTDKAADEFVLIFSTFATQDEARRVCRVLVEERLIACANILPDAESIYAWQGAIEHASECVTLLKSSAQLFERVQQRIGELHSYAVPECLAVNIEMVSGPYAAWLRSLFVA